MEDQLSLMEQMDRNYKIGDEVTTKISKIGKDGVVVYLLGFKIDGIIPFKELALENNLDNYLATIKEGDEITAKIIKLRDENGNVILSRVEYEKKEAVKEIENLFKNNETFKVFIKEETDKGLIGYYKGIRIFIPGSQVDIRFSKDRSNLVGTDLEVKLIDYSAEKPFKIIASRKVILEEEQRIKEESAWSKIKIGDVVKVEVKRFTNFGAFVDVYGIDGLIHLSQISWSHVKSAESALKVGEIIDAKIIEADKENNRLSLSIKELTEEPWENIENKYPEGSVVLGKVARIREFGAFVELEPGVDGLVHISKISHNRVTNPADVLKVGEEVKALIISVDKENKKIALSIKDTE